MQNFKEIFICCRMFKAITFAMPIQKVVRMQNFKEIFIRCRMFKAIGLAMPLLYNQVYVVVDLIVTGTIIIDSIYTSVITIMNKLYTLGIQIKLFCTEQCTKRLQCITEFSHYACVVHVRTSKLVFLLTASVTSKIRDAKNAKF